MRETFAFFTTVIVITLAAYLLGEYVVGHNILTYAIAAVSVFVAIFVSIYVDELGESPTKNQR